MDESELWFLTIIRVEGARLLRPEKPQKLIIAINVDGHYNYETVLGIDGENRNLQQRLCLSQMSNSSIIQINAWRSTFGKKRRRKRNLVAAASHTLGDLLERQAEQSSVNFRIQLEYRPLPKQTAVGPTKMRDGGILYLKLQPLRYPTLPSNIPGSPTVTENESCVSDIENSRRLPQFTVVEPPVIELTLSERILSSFTMYRELTLAASDDQYGKVFEKLRTEWIHIGGLLVGLAGVDMAVFKSMLTIGTYAQRAIATSAVATGLGIACDAWFLLRYNWAEFETFKKRALDMSHESSYFFFSLSARLPAICMFTSALSLFIFLCLAAFEVFPEAAWLMSCFVGVIMTLQFLIYGVQWFFRLVTKCSMIVLKMLRTRN